MGLKMRTSSDSSSSSSSSSSSEQGTFKRLRGALLSKLRPSLVTRRSSTVASDGLAHSSSDDALDLASRSEDGRRAVSKSPRLSRIAESLKPRNRRFRLPLIHRLQAKFDSNNNEEDDPAAAGRRPRAASSPCRSPRLVLSPSTTASTQRPPRADLADHLGRQSADQHHKQKTPKSLHGQTTNLPGSSSVTLLQQNRREGDNVTGLCDPTAKCDQSGKVVGGGAVGVAARPAAGMTRWGAGIPKYANATRREDRRGLDVACDADLDPQERDRRGCSAQELRAVERVEGWRQARHSVMPEIGCFAEQHESKLRPAGRDEVAGARKCGTPQPVIKFLELGNGNRPRAVSSGATFRGQAAQNVESCFTSSSSSIPDQDEWQSPENRVEALANVNRWRMKYRHATGERGSEGDRMCAAPAQLDKQSDEIRKGSYPFDTGFRKSASGSDVGNNCRQFPSPSAAPPLPPQQQQCRVVYKQSPIVDATTLRNLNVGTNPQHLPPGIGGGRRERSLSAGVSVLPSQPTGSMPAAPIVKRETPAVVVRHPVVSPAPIVQHQIAHEPAVRELMPQAGRVTLAQQQHGHLVQRDTTPQREGIPAVERGVVVRRHFLPAYRVESPSTPPPAALHQNVSAAMPNPRIAYAAPETPPRKIYERTEGADGQVTYRPVVGGVVGAAVGRISPNVACHAPQEFGAGARRIVHVGGTASARASGTTVGKLPPELQLNPSDVTFHKKIGAGASAEVWKASWRSCDVAVKILHSRTMRPELLPGDFYRELEIMTRLRHPNLVLLMGASVTQPPVCLVTEFCSGGDLYSLLHGTPLPAGCRGGRSMLPLSWSQRVDIASDVARGCAFLHTSTPQIIHGDLKSPNILLSQPVKSSSDRVHVKITDFGLSRLTRTGEVTTTCTAGTGLWMAPELFNPRNSYDEKVDVYAFGVLLYEIVTRTLPCADLPALPLHELGRRVSGGLRPDLKLVPSDCPKGMSDLMVRCWSHHAALRPSFEDAITQLKAVSAYLGSA